MPRITKFDKTKQVTFATARRAGKASKLAGRGAGVRKKDNDSWGERIRSARVRRGLTQAELAKRLGVSRGAPSMWEIDRARPDPDRLPELARELGVSVDHICGNERVDRQGERTGIQAPPTVPLLTPAEVAAWGAGRYAQAQASERVQTSISISYGKGCAMTVANNAMAPAFPPGCIVVISREHEPSSGAPVVIDMGRGAPMLRYLIDEGTEPTLAPENPQFQLMPLGEGKIIGRVVEVIVRRTLL